MTGALTRTTAFHIADVVFHEDGVMVEPLQTPLAQQMGQPVAARLILTIGDDFAPLRHDKGRPVWKMFRILAWVHCCSLPMAFLFC